MTAEPRLLLVDWAGRCTPLAPGDALVVGRGGDADLTVRSRDVSRRHAIVACAPDGTVTVRDLGSTNGTHVCSDRVGPSPVRLNVGDMVTFGDAQFVLEEARQPAAPAPASPATPARGEPVLAGRTVALPPETPSGVVRRLLVELGSGEQPGHVVERELTGVPVSSFLPLFRKTSGMLEVKGDTSGFVAFRGGRFEDAETDCGLSGREAFRALFAVRRGSFVLRASDGTAEGSQEIRRIKETRSLERLFDSDFPSDELEESAGVAPLAGAPEGDT